ncbi:hypothetical protein like AT3G14470 [Hibiscus trionum]|uniref:Rx N-terminal domain-containing protein n=1 Tax=Hibiscus trionum TaxID=183268 RepID=A0A9W7MB54_HIBTR|nr:hypothetical protein like AT3G14470 [Hibiscus trionum]
MDDAVIGAAVKVALSKSINILEDQINLAWDFKDELSKLRSSLAVTRAFVQDAERKQLDEPVKVWLEQLRDAAYQADDVLDELAYQHLQRKVDTRKTTRISNFFSPSKNPLAITLKMAKKVKNVGQSIKDVNRQATELGLQQRVQVSAPVASGVGGGTHSLVDSSSVVGREADIQRVVDLLIGSTSHQRHHVPVEIGCLTNLQTLPLFRVGTKKGRGIGELGFLVELGGELVICGLENVADEEKAWGARLWEKKKLHKLVFEWKAEREGYDEDEEVLERLEPHSNLKSLSICFYNGECYPSWLLWKIGGHPSACFQPLNLVELKLVHCSYVMNLPSLGQYPNLKSLEMDSLKSVRCIGNEFYMNGCNENKPIAFFPALETFILKDMLHLKEWLEPEPMIPVFPSLKVLEIEYCKHLNSVPRMSRFSSLEKLKINVCPELGWIGDEPFSSSLKILEIGSCENLISIPSLDGLSSLLELELEECIGLTSLPSGLSTCTSLQRLVIDHCSNLESIPEGVGQLNSLRYLAIDRCSNLESIPEDVGQLHSLEELAISYCPNLKRLPEESLACLTSLKTLRLGGFSEELEEFPGLGSIHHLHSSLKVLRLYGWNKLCYLPHKLQHLTALEHLDIASFNGLRALPEWFGNLSSLQILYLVDCKTLVHLPSKEALQRLSKLHTFRIYSCPRLKGKQLELSKISKIPYYFID